MIVKLMYGQSDAFLLNFSQGKSYSKVKIFVI